jgi:predicted dehydrogenase
MWKRRAVPQRLGASDLIGKEGPMSGKVSIVLAGIGGYGGFYVKLLLDNMERGDFEIVGAVDPNPDGCGRLGELKELGVPAFSTLEEFYHDRSADLAVLATPIHLHCDHVCYALSQGSHVLCEKPMCVTIQDANRMIEAGKKAGKFVAIGYQWSYSEPVQRLKRGILDGRFGRAKRLKSITLWPRPHKYYSRNPWAGKLRAEDGAWVLDSPASNAMAHFLHNMFYILGETREASAMPIDVLAELYRASPIESYDTIAMRCHTAAGAAIHFYAAHTIHEFQHTFFEYEFDLATILCEGRWGKMWVKFKDGAIEQYGQAEDFPADKLWDSIEAAKGGKPVACPAEAAAAHTLCINGIQESSGITEFPADIVSVVEQNHGPQSIVEGLKDAMQKCYDEWKLPSELGLAWSKRGETVDLRDYKKFPAAT